MPFMQYDWCPYKMRRDTDTEGRPCEDGGRGRSDAVASQGKPEPPVAGRGKEGPPPRAFGEGMALTAP